MLMGFALRAYYGYEIIRNSTLFTTASGPHKLLTHTGQSVTFLFIIQHFQSNRILSPIVLGQSAFRKFVMPNINIFL